MRLYPALLWVLLLLLPSLGYPHGGGLDSYGCHHDRKQGGYHCHRGQFAGKQFGSKEEMLRQLKTEAPKKAAPSQQSSGNLGSNPPGPSNEKAVGTTPTGKTIYEGPRGGQYHYSKSGKKVYERRK